MGLAEWMKVKINGSLEGKLNIRKRTLSITHTVEEIK
jgi:hypothetical protein